MSMYDQYGYKRSRKKRKPIPLQLRFVCAVMFAYGIFEIIHTYTGIYSGVHVLYPAVNALVIVFSFVALSGIWSFEKWGPISFIIVLLLKYLVDFLFGKFDTWLLTGLIPALYFMTYYKKMRKTV